MPNNVDQRIVEMQFDNAQFENGIQQSVGSLEQLKSSLDFSDVDKNSISNLFNATKSIESVEKTAGTIDKFKSSAVDAAKFAGKAIATFGKVSVATLGGIATAIGGLALKGGITRAMNLKQADFMLQGLVKDEKAVAKIMENVNASVDGTAYSLDQAALVAAQFAATGMRGGEEMEGALKGVAGAAAVFGADYQRVGQIFTQVAGQGRLMGNDLLQLSSMGMNAAATLADYLNKTGQTSNATEADIRDMVSKSKIDFNTFAAAMNWAFGEQAAKANETFSGALANMRSALSRIGEKFASPVIDALRDLFNAIRPLINMVNEQMTPVFETFGNGVEKVRSKVVGFLDSIGSKGTVLKSDIKEISKWWGDGYPALAKYFEGIKKGTYSASDDLTKMIKKLGKSGEITEKQAQKIVKAGKVTYADLKTAMEETDKQRPVLIDTLQDAETKGTNAAAKIAEYFNDVNKGTISASKETKKYVKDVTNGEKATEKLVRKLVEQKKITNEIYANATGETVWKNANDDLSIFATTFRSFTWLVSSFTPLITALKDAFIAVFDAPEVNLRQMADSFRDFAYQFKISEETIEKFKSVFIGVFTVLKGVGTIFSGLFTVFKPFIDGLISISKVALTVASNLGKIVVSVGEFISSTGVVGSIATGLAGIFKVFVNAMVGIANIAGKLSTIFASMASGLRTLQSGVSIILNPIEALRSLLESLFDAINSAILNVLPSISTAIEKLGDAFSHFSIGDGEKIGEVFDRITKAISAGGMGAAVVLLNKFINVFKEGGFQVSVNLMKPLSNCLSQLGKTLEVYQTTLKAKALKEIATAIIILAGAVWILSTIDPKRLASALIGVEALLLSLFGTISIFTSSLGKKGMIQSIANMIQIGTAMVAMATAILILSGALKLLSTCSWSEIARGIFAIASMCIILGKVSSRLDSSNKNLKRTARALIIFGIAIRVMAEAVKALGSLSVETLAKGLGSVIVLIVAISQMLNHYQGQVLKGSVSLVIFAGALNVMAYAVKQLGSLDGQTLAEGLLGISTILGAIALFVGKGKFGSFKPSDATSLIIMAGALALMAEAVSKLGNLGGDQLVNGLFAITALMAAIGSFTKVMSKGNGVKSFIGAAASMAILAASMEILTDVVEKLGAMNSDQLGQGLIGLGAALIMIAGAMKIMPKGATTIAQSVAMSIMAAAIATLSESLSQMGGMSIQQMGIALLGLAAGVGAMVGALAALEKIKGTSLDSAAAIVTMAEAVALLAPSLVILGKMKLENIGKALIAVAGAFLIFGVAAAAINSGIVLNMLALSSSIAMVGLSCLAVGAGLSMFAEGLIVLGEVGETSFDNLNILIENLIALIPDVFALIAQGIVEMIAVLGQNAARLAEVGLQLLIALMTSIRNHIGEIVTLALEIIANFITGIANGIGMVIDAAFNLGLAFINGLADAIRNNQELIFSAVANLVSAILEFVLTAFQEIAEEIPVIGDDISKGLDKAKEIVKSKLAPGEGEKSGEQYGKGISGGVEKSAGETKKAGEKHAKQAAAGAKKPELMKAAAEGMGSAYNTAVGKAASNSKAAGEKLPKQAAAGAGKTNDIKKAGEKGGTEYSKGVGSKDDSAKKAGSSIADKAKSGMDSVSGYYGLGSDAAAGFVSGAGSKGSSAYSAGWSLASSYYNAIKERLKEKSPSKETYKLAVWAVQGFINPAHDMANKVKSAGIAVAENMLTGMKSQSLAADISEIMPDQMTITPVVDLSGVKAAAADMNSIFTGASTIRATSGIQVNKNAMAERVDRLFEAVAEMKQNVAAQPGAQITNNITVDGAENPEQFATRFVRQLELEMRTGYYG